MSGDLLKFGGQTGSSWYYFFEQEALTDPQAAEANWFPEPRPNAVASMREVIAKYAAMSEEEKQAGRDALMRKIDTVLKIGRNE